MTAEQVPTFGVIDDGTFDTPQLAEARAAGGRSVLEEIEADVAEEQERPPVTLKVRPKKRTALRFTGSVDPAHLELWQDRCTTKRGTPQARTDLPKLSAIVVANLCEAVVDSVTGQDVMGPDGVVLNFKHPHWLQMLGCQPGEAQQAVRNLFGKDPAALLIMANDVTENAGYTLDGTERVDPTQPTG